LTKVHLRPETKVKLRKIREELDKELKADAEKDKKEEVNQYQYRIWGLVFANSSQVGTSCTRS